MQSSLVNDVKTSQSQTAKLGTSVYHRNMCICKVNKKAQLSLTNPRDACEKFARFTYEQWGCKLYSKLAYR